MTHLLGVTNEINTCVHKGSNKSISIYFLTKQNFHRVHFYANSSYSVTVRSMDPIKDEGRNNCGNSPPRGLTLCTIVGLHDERHFKDYCSEC